MRPLAIACLTLPLMAQAELVRSRIAGQLARLDELFARRDATGYLAAFAPLWVGPHERLAARLRALAEAPVALQRSGQLTDLEQRGTTWIAHVWFDHACLAAAAGEPEPAKVRESALLVFSERDGALQPRAQLEVDACGLERVRTGFLECAACNFRIGTGREWLLVPACPERAMCADAVTFLALDADVALDLGVRIADRDETAQAALGNLVARHRPQAPVEVEGWPGQEPAAAGARCRLQDPARTTTLHLRTAGRMQYLLALHGPEPELARRAAAAQELLASFALLQPGRDPDDVARAALAAHGAQLELVGDEYHCAKLGLAFRAPQHWQKEQRLGGGALVYELACPRGRGTLRLTAWRPPNGAQAWTEALADTALAARVDLAGARDSKWRAAGDGRERDVVVPRREGQQEQRLRVLLWKDLLVIVQGRCFVEAEQTVRSAITSLRRL